MATSQHTPSRASGIISRQGRSVTFEVICSNDPTRQGRMVFRLTEQMSKYGEGLVPQKVCAKCRRSFPVIAFIKSQKLRTDGYSIVQDDARCHLCMRPPVFAFHFNSRGQLQMRLDLHDENGEPIRHWDEKTHRWHALKNVGLRLMTRSNEIRLQPYADRQTSKSGFSYDK